MQENASKKRKDFPYSWEQRKLGDITIFRRGLTYSPINIDPKGIRVLRSSNIAEDAFVKSDDDVFVKTSAANIPYVETGDILITAANGSSRLVGKHAIIFHAQERMVHGGFMLLAHPRINPFFVNALMSAPWYAIFINTYIAGGNGAIGNLNKNDLEDQNVFIPSKTEQQKIGSFFRSLDDLITLHQREFFCKKHLETNKFHRCKTIAWEQRKLGDITIFVIVPNFVKNTCNFQRR